MKYLFIMLLAFFCNRLYAQTNTQTVPDTSRQYVNLKQRFINGDRSDSVVLSIMPMALANGDKATAVADHNAYWELVKGHLNKDNVHLIVQSFSSVKDKGFKELAEDTAK